jgi:hypothetical protein
MKTILRLVLILLVLWINAGIKIQAQEENFIAASIYNFTRNINWPTSDQEGNFVIDIIGHKSVYDKLKELMVGRKAGSQNIEVRYLESVSNITRSHILFVGFWQSKDMAKVIEKIGSTHTLIISEKAGMIDAGAGINFVIINSVIKFEIKPANIQKYSLVVADPLIKMAYKVY